MKVGWFAVFSVFAGFGVGLGCTMSTSFACSSDDQCIAAGIEGVCAEAGYCAFPDGECAGGFAYGQHAGEGLAGECLGDEGTGSTTALQSEPPTPDGGTTSGASTSDEGSSEDTSDGSESSGDPDPVCGNGIVEGTEVCDGPVPNADCTPDCTAVECMATFTDCNRQPDDGCEAQLGTAAHCRSCDDRCDSGTCGEQGGEAGCHMLAFTTASNWTGDLGGLDGGDDKCQAEAEGAGLTGTYRAWLSEGTSGPLDRFELSTFPYQRPDGEIVANSWNDLVDGGTDLGAALEVTLDGMSPPVVRQQICNEGVWSNVPVTGDTGPTTGHCDGWTNADSTGRVGQFNQTGSAWTWWCEVDCDSLRPLYCFEQPQPATVDPEPPP